MQLCVVAILCAAPAVVMLLRDPTVGRKAECVVLIGLLMLALIICL